MVTELLKMGNALDILTLEKGALTIVDLIHMYV
jgi:hypothetical protein